jgi:hypothetical protein
MRSTVLAAAVAAAATLTADAYYINGARALDTHDGFFEDVAAAAGAEWDGAAGFGGRALESAGDDADAGAADQLRLFVRLNYFNNPSCSGPVVRTDTRDRESRFPPAGGAPRGWDPPCPARPPPRSPRGPRTTQRHRPPPRGSREV